MALEGLLYCNYRDSCTAILKIIIDNEVIFYAHKIVNQQYTYTGYSIAAKQNTFRNPSGTALYTDLGKYAYPSANKINSDGDAYTYNFGVLGITCVNNLPTNNSQSYANLYIIDTPIKFEKSLKVEAGDIGEGFSEFDIKYMLLDE